MIQFGARREVKRYPLLSDPEFMMSQSAFPTLSHTFRVWDKVGTLNFLNELIMGRKCLVPTVKLSQVERHAESGFLEGTMNLGSESLC